MKLKDLYTDKTFAKYLKKFDTFYDTDMEYLTAIASYTRHEIIFLFNNLNQDELYYLFNEHEQEWQEQFIDSYGEEPLDFDFLISFLVVNRALLQSHEYSIYNEEQQLVIGNRYMIVGKRQQLENYKA